jgi:hypothetical protein
MINPTQPTSGDCAYQEKSVLKSNRYLATQTDQFRDLSTQINFQTADIFEFDSI